MCVHLQPHVHLIVISIRFECDFLSLYFSPLIVFRPGPGSSEQFIKQPRKNKILIFSEINSGQKPEHYKQGGKKKEKLQMT